MTGTKTFNIQHLFFREVSAAPLVIFRIVFGLLMLFGTIRFISKGWVELLYIEPQFHFSYYGFSWIKTLPDFWMYLPFVVLLISSVGIVFGAFYRWSSILFFLAFTYVELLDKSYYLNHYYFVSLIAFLLCFLPANADFSYDAKRNPKMQSKYVAAWHIWIIQLQLGLVYFFAGVAKIQSDWLIEAQPLRTWLQAYRDLPIVGDLFAGAFIAYFFSWFGCIYDLSIPFFLSLRKTRKWAYFFVVVFHVVTWLLFPIGVFPWVMIFSTSIFFAAAFHERILDQLKKWLRWSSDQIAVQQVKIKRGIIFPVVCYITIQVFVPFRYLAYPGELFWHEQGFRFSWRVMLMHKEGNATFYVRDRHSGQQLEIDNASFLTSVQEDQMATQPDFILQYAHFLHKRFQDTTFVFGEQVVRLKDPSIHAQIFVTLNGRPSKLFVHPRHDLSQKKLNFEALKWIERY